MKLWTILNGDDVEVCLSKDQTEGAEGSVIEHQVNVDFLEGLDLAQLREFLGLQHEYVFEVTVEVPILAHDAVEAQQIFDARKDKAKLVFE